MPEGSIQSISGQDNIGISNVDNSPITIINNYGIPSAPPPLQEQDPFANTLRKYSYKQNPPPELFLVNCDRSEELDMLLDHKNLGNRHQVYFLLSCPTQHPICLTQRFVFEIMEEAGDFSSIQYKRTNEFEGARRIAIHPLEPGHKIDWLRRTWLNQLQKGEYAFSEFLEKELSKLPYKYIVSAFELSTIEWRRKYLEPVLQTWIEDFSKAPCTGPQCLFFFILNIKEIHKSRHLDVSESDILTCVQTLKERYSDNSILIESLSPVGVHFVESWLDKVLDGIRPMKLFEQWIQTECGQDICVDPGMCLDMQLIHAFQRKVWLNGHNLR